MLKITDYAEKLIEGLDHVDYIERVKVSQKNWIGKSQGAEVDFSIKGKEDKLRVYTTRCDTLFGVTSMVVSPEHPIIDKYRDELKTGMRLRHTATRQRRSLILSVQSLPRRRQACRSKV